MAHAYLVLRGGISAPSATAVFAVAALALRRPSPSHPRGADSRRRRHRRPAVPDAGQRRLRREALHARRCATRRPSRSQTVAAPLTMVAAATQSLSRFNLDFAGDSVRARHASTVARPRLPSWARRAPITPARGIRDHERFAADADPTPPARTSNPRLRQLPAILPFGWFTADGSVTAGQPIFSHAIYPVNDHPADKASYTSASTSPRARPRSANGELATATRVTGARTGATSCASPWRPS